MSPADVTPLTGAAPLALTQPMSLCAWCHNAYPTLLGFGIFCSRACALAEVQS